METTYSLMSSDLIQEIIELLEYATEHKDWNSADEALELLKGEVTNSEFDGDDS